MTKTMLDIAYESLQDVEKQTLKQLYAIVAKELKPRWKEEQSHLSVPEIEKSKLGELYKLLTVDGRFLRTKEGSWTLVEKFTFEERKTLKLASKETIE
ncbi:DNA-directed RNA polymerase subunit delta [Mycoplasma marinum]|uniref:DNA-directed RNA polymerase subunit delta n=1 Tax=Mycoplasma marinum TaxID=1937190 RepID=A0A4R0XR98_9MOLU|nr:DNA-directed RNA polymerase subunit delta [Mycoplasma marinum]TCG10920.1 DNA-directed RNA polymerase subunit delta [Mycoplasma marinum]